MANVKLIKTLEYLLSEAKEFSRHKKSNPLSQEVLALSPDLLIEAYVGHIKEKLSSGQADIFITVEFYRFLQEEIENYERQVRRARFDEEFRKIQEEFYGLKKVKSPFDKL